MLLSPVTVNTAVLRLPLEKMKLKIQTNLDQLEKGGLTSRKDNYQSIINSVVQVRTDELTKAMNICSIPWS